MKVIFTLLTAAILFTSCSGPSANLEVSNPNPKINETIKIRNTSDGGDISYIKMNGSGVMNKFTQVGADVTISNPRFSFKYDKPGNYKIEVFVETTSVFGGAEISTQHIDVNVIDPNARPYEPPVIIVTEKNVLQNDPGKGQ